MRTVAKILLPVRLHGTSHRQRQKVHGSEFSVNKVIKVIVALIVGASAGVHICAGLWDDSWIPVVLALAGIYNKADNAEARESCA